MLTQMQGFANYGMRGLGILETYMQHLEFALDLLVTYCWACLHSLSYGTPRNEVDVLSAHREEAETVPLAFEQILKAVAKESCGALHQQYVTGQPVHSTQVLAARLHGQQATSCPVPQGSGGLPLP